MPGVRSTVYRVHVTLVALGTLLCLAGCGRLAARALQGEDVPVPAAFDLPSDRTPCYLELAEKSLAIRVNCFDIDGVLHIHSSRWAKLPRVSGESWTVTIRRQPRVRVEIGGRIYGLTATAIDDESRRREILHDRGYWYAWDAITVFQFRSE